MINPDGLAFLAAVLGGAAAQQHWGRGPVTEQYRILQGRLHEYDAAIADKDAKLKRYSDELQHHRATIAELERKTQQHKGELYEFKKQATSLEQARVLEGHQAQQLLEEERRAKAAQLQQAEEKLHHTRAAAQTMQQHVAKMVSQNSALELSLAQGDVALCTLAQQLLQKQAENHSLRQELSQQQSQQQTVLLRPNLKSMQRRLRLPALAMGSILSIYWYTHHHQQQQQHKDAAGQLTSHPGLGLGSSGASVQELQLLVELEGAVADVVDEGTQLLSAWQAEDRELATAGAAAWWVRRGRGG